MAGRVEIVNVALARLGEGAIQTLDEGSAPANAAKVVYDTSRRSALRDYPWAFATRRESLARLVESPVGFQHAFALPSGCLRILGVYDTAGGEVPYELRGKTLCSSANSVVACYTDDVIDEAMFDPAFVDALTFRLASDLAVPVKGSVELMARYAEEYHHQIRQAATVSAREDRERIVENPYLEARA